MRSDSLFSAILVSALAAVGATAAMTVGSPAAGEIVRRATLAQPHAVTLPMVVVTGKRETRVASQHQSLATRLQ